MTPTTFARCEGGLAFFHDGKRVAVVAQEHLITLILQASLICAMKDERGLTVAPGCIVRLDGMPALIFEAACKLRHG